MIFLSVGDEESHLQTLAEVFRRQEEHGFRLKQEKCEFRMSSQLSILAILKIKMVSSLFQAR